MLSDYYPAGEMFPEDKYFHIDKDTVEDFIYEYPYSWLLLILNGYRYVVCELTEGRLRTFLKLYTNGSMCLTKRRDETCGIDFVVSQQDLRPEVIAEFVTLRKMLPSGNSFGLAVQGEIDKNL